MQQVMLVKEYDEERWHDRYGDYTHTCFFRKAFKNKKVLLEYLQENIYEDEYIDVVVDSVEIFDEDEENLLKEKGLHNLIKDRYFVRTEGIKPKYKTLKPYLKHNFTLEKDSYNLITIDCCLRYLYLKEPVEIPYSHQKDFEEKDAEELMENCKKDLSVCAEVLNTLEEDYCEWDLGDD